MRTRLPWLSAKTVRLCFKGSDRVLPEEQQDRKDIPGSQYKVARRFGVNAESQRRSAAQGISGDVIYVRWSVNGKLYRGRSERKASGSTGWPGTRRNL